MVAFTLTRTPVALATGRSAVSAPRQPRQQRSVVRHGIPNPFAAGEVNDPEKTAERKEEKKGEYWGEPKNKNKLEKTKAAHDVELTEGIQDAGKKVEDAIKGAGDKLKEATGQK